MGRARAVGPDRPGSRRVISCFGRPPASVFEPFQGMGTSVRESGRPKLVTSQPSRVPTVVTDRTRVGHRRPGVVRDPVFQVIADASEPLTTTVSGTFGTRLAHCVGTSAVARPYAPHEPSPFSTPNLPMTIRLWAEIVGPQGERTYRERMGAPQVIPRTGRRDPLVSPASV